jgi:autotransporter-associated beta strand protein
VNPGSKIEVDGHVLLGASSTFSVTSGAGLEISGDFGFAHTNEANFNLHTATVTYLGDDGNSLEVGGTDSGLVGVSAGNFGIGQLVIGTPSQPSEVELVDLINNGNRNGPGGAAEALYLSGSGGPAGLVLNTDSVLVLNHLNVYAWDPLAGQQVHLNSLFGPGQLSVPYGQGTLQLSSAFQSFEWDAASGGSWTNSGNWNPQFVPDGNHRAILADAISAPATITLDDDIEISQIEFNNAAHSYTIAGDGTHGLELRGAARVEVTAGSHTIDAPLSGTNGLTKTGAGTLRLGGANSYSGPTNIQAGTLRAAAAENLGASDTITVDAGATFDTTEGAVFQLQAGKSLTGRGAVRANLLAMLPGSELRGALQIQGNLTSAGRVAPGFSPEIMVIVGNYSQQPTGVLEMEVGGTTPGSDHDMLIVTGTASLAGRLEMPIINGYVPQVGHEMQLLLASNVVGDFDSRSFSPDLATLNPNVAHELETTSSGVRLLFVAPEDDNDFQPVAPTTNWADAANWSTGVIPTSRDIITVENASAQLQRLDVEELIVLPNSKNAFTHELTLLGATETMAVTVQSGSSLSATIGVNVADKGLLELDGGTVVAHDVDIQPGGTVAGEGTLVGKVIVGATVGPREATLSPGVTAGHLDVEGDYEQGLGGTLLMEVDGFGPGERDTIDVTGAVQLGGTLCVDTSNFTTSTPGTTVEIISAGSLTGAFTSVEAFGDSGVYFHPIYDYVGGAVNVMQLERGDMNGDQSINTEDHDLFVFGLMNASTSRFLAQCNCDVFPQEGGDFNGNGRLDFDDIPGFQERIAGMGMSPDLLSAAFERYFSNVPEPSSATLAAFGTLLFLAGGSRPGFKGGSRTDSARKHRA